MVSLEQGSKSRQIVKALKTWRREGSLSNRKGSLL